MNEADKKLITALLADARTDYRDDKSIYNLGYMDGIKSVLDALEEE